jgi:hypothetical protein
MKATYSSWLFVFYFYTRVLLLHNIVVATGVYNPTNATSL